MPALAIAKTDKPNILVVWGDDIGQSNVSAYTMGLMGYRTPNIDRIAKEGMIFTDYYGEQSCTAGRSAYITGQSVFRTGLSKVGLPGAELGMQEEDPTIAVSPLESFQYLGGAGIVAGHASKLGASVDFYGVVGLDEAGTFAKEKLRDIQSFMVLILKLKTGRKLKKMTF